MLIMPGTSFLTLEDILDFLKLIHILETPTEEV
jgi:hypothetical protein